MNKKLERTSLFGASFRKLSMLFTADGGSTAHLSTVDQEDSGPNRRTLVFFGSGDSGKTVLAQQIMLGFQPSLQPNISPEASREKIMNTVLDEARFILMLLEEHGKASTNLLKSTVELRQKEGKRDFVEFCKLILQIAALPDLSSLLKDNYLQFRQPRPRRFLHISKVLKEHENCFSDWIPSTNEILLNVPATTGMSPSFCISENKDLIEIYDVGGSRSERKKWRIIMNKLHETTLESSCVLIFTVALADFDAPLFEKLSVKRLEDSLDAFQKTVGNVDIPFSKVFLVFTKRDLLTKTLSNNATMSYLKQLGFTGKTDDEFLVWIENLFLKSVADTLYSRGDDFVRCRDVSCFSSKSCSNLVDELYTELL